MGGHSFESANHLGVLIIDPLKGSMPVKDTYSDLYAFQQILQKFFTLTQGLIPGILPHYFPFKREAPKRIIFINPLRFSKT
jgi:hypothetical protein